MFVCSLDSPSPFRSRTRIQEEAAKQAPDALGEFDAVIAESLEGLGFRV